MRDCVYCNIVSKHNSKQAQEEIPTLILFCWRTFHNCSLRLYKWFGKLLNMIFSIHAHIYKDECKQCFTREKKCFHKVVRAWFVPMMILACCRSTVGIFFFSNLVPIRSSRCSQWPGIKVWKMYKLKNGRCLERKWLKVSKSEKK